MRTLDRAALPAAYCASMKLDRRTVNFAPGEAAFLDLYREADTPEHHILQALCPDVTADSDSAILKALVCLAHATIEEQAMRSAYDQAVDSGEFDAESRAAMSRSRRTVASIVGQTG